ncbi:hypothetical protein BBP40_009984 [Aspergillus hancockii]|nr:hypothetical protein BBP40_009984 [Aspergillus hancockii]
MPSYQNDRAAQGSDIASETAPFIPQPDDGAETPARYPQPRRRLGLLSTTFLIDILRTIRYRAKYWECWCSAVPLGGIGSIAIAENVLLVTQATVGDWVKRCIAITIMVGIAATHIYRRSWSVKLMDILASVKLLVLALIILTGLRLLYSGSPNVTHPGASYDHPFAGSSTRPSDYTMALYKVLATFQGWSNAMYVLDEVKDPRKTLKAAGVLGLGSVGVLYVLVNAVFFIAATPKELGETGITVVALFIGKVFGEKMQRFTAVLAALSSLGNIMTASFSMSRVIHGFAEEGLLPFSSFFARRSSSGSPSGAFALVFLSSCIMIIAVPFGEAYNFLLDVGQWAMAVIQLFVVCGLFIIRKRLTYPAGAFKPQGTGNQGCLFG